MPRKKKPASETTPLPPAGERVYRGRRTAGGAVVTVVEGGVERPLALRLDLRRHSPTGFGWSYAGSGPAQLALALAADALGDDARAEAVHQRLKAAVVARLDANEWELTADQVRAAVAAAERGPWVPPAAGADDPAGRPEPAASPTTGGEADSPPPADPTPRVEAEVPTTDAPPPDASARAGEPSHVDAVRPDGPRVPNPFGYKQDAVAGVRLLEDRRYKQAQIQFADKPGEAVRQVVRDAGFRWLQEEGVWAKQIDKEKGWQTRADAEALFERVAAMIRAEQGVGHEVV